MWRSIAALFLSGALLTAGCSGDDTPSPEATVSPMETPMLSSTQPPADGLQVALAYDGDVFIWNALMEAPQEVFHRDGDQEIVAIQQSPDGRFIAFHDVGGSDVWVISESGEDIATVGIQPIIQQTMWDAAHNLVLNTAEATLDLTPRNDLYKYDVDSAALEQFEAGGAISVSPSGEIVLLTRPGTVNGARGMIFLPGEVDTPLLEFDAVATGTHSGYYPLIQWVGNSRFYSSIPHVDAYYSEFDPQAPPATVFEVDLDTGSSQVIANVQASVYGLPQVSPLTQQLVFLRRGQEVDTINLLVADASGESETVYTSLPLSSHIPPVWLPDGERFLYAAEGIYYIGQPGAAPIRWLDFSGDGLTTPLIVGQYMVFTRVILASDRVELRYASLADDSGTSSLITSVSGEYLTFDADDIEG